MAQEYEYGHLSDAEYRKLAKAVNQRMVQAEKDGRTSDPQYMSLQRVLSEKGKAATKGGKYRFPEFPSRLTNSEKVTYKKVLDEYRYSLYASERSQKQVFKKKLDELEKIEALRGLVGEYRKGLTDKKRSFDVVFNQFTEAQTSRATAEGVEEIKRRFWVYLKSTSTYYSQLTEEVKEWLLNALAAGALEGQFESSSPTYASQDDVDYVTEVAIELGEEIKARKDAEGLNPDNQAEADWINDLLRRWLAMDDTSRSRYASIQDFIDQNWFH